MTDKSPLARLPTAGGTTPESTKTIVPETIRLPDGREFRVRDILVKPRNKVSYNLRTGRVGRAAPGTRPRTVPRKPYKYTVDERVWQSDATVAEIAERYGITLLQAKQVQYNSRYIIGKLGIDRPGRP